MPTARAEDTSLTRAICELFPIIGQIRHIGISSLTAGTYLVQARPLLMTMTGGSPGGGEYDTQSRNGFVHTDPSMAPFSRS